MRKQTWSSTAKSNSDANPLAPLIAQFREPEALPVPQKKSRRQREKAAKARAAENPESSTAGSTKLIYSPKDAKSKNWQASLSIDDCTTLKAAEAVMKHKELHRPRPADKSRSLTLSGVSSQRSRHAPVLLFHRAVIAVALWKFHLIARHSQRLILSDRT